MEGLLKNCIVLSLGLHVLEFYMFLHVLAISICLHGSFCGFCLPLTTGEILAPIFAIMQGESFRDQIRSSWEFLVDVKRYAVTAKLHCIRIDIWMQ